MLFPSFSLNLFGLTDLQHILCAVFLIKKDFIFHGYICIQSYIAVTFHTGTCWNQLTDNNILFQTDQMVNLSIDCCLCQNLGGFLE